MRPSTIIFAATLATAAYAAPSVHNARSTIDVVSQPIVQAPAPVKASGESGALNWELFRKLATAPIIARDFEEVVARKEIDVEAIRKMFSVTNMIARGEFDGVVAREFTEHLARAAADESGSFDLGSLFSGILKTFGLGRREYDQHLARASSEESGAIDFGALLNTVLHGFGLSRREFDEIAAREFSEHVARAATDADFKSFFSSLFKGLGFGRREFEEALLARSDEASTPVDPDLDSGAFSLGSLFSGILKTLGLGRRELDELLAREPLSNLQQFGSPRPLPGPNFHGLRIPLQSFPHAREVLSREPLSNFQQFGAPRPRPAFPGIRVPLQSFPQVKARQLLEKQARSLNDLD